MKKKHEHVWIKIAEGTYRCDDWPRCWKMRFDMWPKGQIL